MIQANIRDEQSRVAGLRRRLGVGLEFGPTGEPLFTSEYELRIVQRHQLADRALVYCRPARMVTAQPGDGVRVSRPDRPQEIAGLLLLLFKIQDCLLRMPGPHDRRKRVNKE